MPNKESIAQESIDNPEKVSPKVSAGETEPQELRPNKSILIVGVAGAILLVGTVIVILWQGGYFETPEPTENGDSESTSETANNTAEDLPIEDALSAPEYTAKISTEALPLMQSEAETWSSDVEIRNITATTQYIQSGNEKLYFGNDEGAFSSWSMTLYSESLNQTRVLSMESGITQMNPTNDIDENISEAMALRPSYNNLTAVISSDEVYNKIVENGFNKDENYYNLFLGDAVTSVENQYEGGYIWMAEERSKSEEDNNSTGKLITRYFIDGITGELLDKE